MVVDCIEFCNLSSSLMHLSFTSPWVDPWDTPREPRVNGKILVFLFFLRGEVSYLDLKTTSTKGTYPQNLFEFCSLVYRSRPKFFRANLFHSNATFRYYVMGVHTSPWGRAICH